MVDVEFARIHMNCKISEIHVQGEKQFLWKSSIVKGASEMSEKAPCNRSLCHSSCKILKSQGVGKRQLLIYLTKESLFVCVCVCVCVWCLGTLAESSRNARLVYSLGARGPWERGSQVVPAGQIFPGSKPLEWLQKRSLVSVSGI